jgi:hypothetical protein
MTWRKEADRDGLTLSEWMRRACNEQVQARGDGTGGDARGRAGGVGVSMREVGNSAGGSRAGRSAGVCVSNRVSERVTKTVVGTCVHGERKGNHCWQCRGLAEVKS